MNLRRSLRQLRARLQWTPTSLATVINEADQPASIADGVNYAMPIILPAYVRASMNEAQLQKYITEAAEFHHQFGTPYQQGTPVSPVTEDPLQEWAYSTRLAVLTTCHAAYHRNPLINAAVQYSADFIVGDGFNLNCKNKDVENILYQFIDDELNAIREYERQAAIDLQVDGELFLRTKTGKPDEDTAGLIRAVPMRPWECEYIKTELGDFRVREFYRFQLNQTEGDSPISGTSTETLDISADDMLHVAINRHSYELRGRPELYRILAWARADTEFLENRARQNFWRGALLWWVAVKGATASILSAVSAAWKKPPPPGSTVVTSDAQVVTPLVNSAGGTDAEPDMKAIKNRVIIGFRMPEYFFADGSDANLATATAQQLPALTRFSAFQIILREQLWYPLFRRVLQTAIDAGLIPEEVEEQDADGEPVREEPKPEDAAAAITKTTQKREREQQAERDKIAADAEAEYEAFQAQQPMMPPADGMPKPMMPDMKAGEPALGKVKMIKTIDAFEIQYEPVSANDPKTLAEMLVIAVNQEWASNETAANKLGFDYKLEQKKIRKESLTSMKEMAQGIKPVPPEMRPQGMGQEPPMNGKAKGEQVA